MSKINYKVLKRIKLVITVIIIAGVIIDTTLVYMAASSLKINGERINGIYPENVVKGYYEVKFELQIENPQDKSIEVDYISYNVYINNEFVGKGAKPAFSIPHGVHNYTFSLTFNIYNLSSSTSSIIMNQGNVDVKIKGDVIVPLKFLGLFTWRYIKLPYEKTENVRIK
ncbi:MAG: LEA type 2 family protein [Thermoplasmata archaeon]|nr:LEA type 2 family protein [Thermoplasmata archaeon]